MKMGRLIIMCLPETYSRVWVGKNLCELYSIKNALKNGDALAPFPFNNAADYSISRNRVIQVDL